MQLSTHSSHVEDCDIIEVRTQRQLEDLTRRHPDEEEEGCKEEEEGCKEEEGEEEEKEEG